MINLFLNLISSTWVAPILYNIVILFDAIIYSLADESYKIFNFAATAFNLAGTSDILDAIIKRVMTLVAVFMFFRILMILIQYIIEPDKLADKTIGGGKIVTNVVVVIVMLTLLYSGWLFGIIHDVQTLLFGDANSSYEVIGDWIDTGAENENVIRNLIFGVSDDDFDNFGRELASNMLSNFLYIKNDNEGTPIATSWKEDIYITAGKNGELFNKIAKGTASFFNLFVGTDLGDVNLVYIPVVSAIGGLYMIYMFFKYAIQVIVRSLKLFVMELLAPIAIVSYIDPGKGKDLFKKYFQTYLSIYLELFIKLAMVYLSVIFIKFGVDTVLEGDFISNPGFLTTGIIYILSIIAVFRFMDAAPKLISDVLGIKLDADKKGGFGKMLGAVAGTAIGTGIGIATASKAGVGFGAGAFQAFSGGIQGGIAGGNSKDFSGFTKGISTTGGKISSQSYKIGNMGGLKNYVGGAVGSTFGGNAAADHSIAQLEKNKADLDKKSGIYSQTDTLRGGVDTAINDAFARTEYGKMEDYVGAYTSIGESRETAIKWYEDARNNFAEQALTGQLDIDTIKRAQQQYNDYVDRNQKSYTDSAGAVTPMKIAKFSDIEATKKSNQTFSDSVESGKRDVEDKQKAIKEGRVKMRGTKEKSYFFNSNDAQKRRAQHYKNVESYKGEKKQ